MRKRSILLLVFLALTLIIVAPVEAAVHYEIVWAKLIGEGYGFSLQEAVDGGYVIAGRSLDNAAILVKTDLYGNATWVRRFGSGWSSFYSIKRTSDGGYVAVGQSIGRLSDIYLVKTDVNGSKQWEKWLGGWKNEAGRDVEETSDGGFIVVGFRNPLLEGETEEVYIYRTNSTGDQIWNKTYSGNGIYCRSVHQTSDGGFILAGKKNSENGEGDFYLLKIDASGDLEWEETYGSSSDEAGQSMQITEDGGFIIAGSIKFDLQSDIMLVKTDASGNIQWKRTYGSSSFEEARSIQIANDGGYIVAGGGVEPETGSMSAFYLVRTDSEGNQLWEKRPSLKLFGISGAWESYAYNAIQTKDGGLAVAGYLGSNLFLAKLEDCYYLNLISDQGSVSGEGPYSKGSTAYFSVSPTNVTVGDIRYIFDRWTSDSSAGYSGNNPNAQVVMSQNITETAVWKKQYYLKIESEVPVEGEGWYDEGDVVTLKVPDKNVTVDGTRYIFKGWTSSSAYGYSGSDPNAQVTVKQGIIQKAVWRKQYYLKIESEVPVEGEGWYDEETIVKLTPPPPQGFLIRNVFSGWRGDIQKGADTVFMDKARTVYADWNSDYTYVLLPMLAVTIIAVLLPIIRSRKKMRAA